jgi:hypothetical protein
VPEEFLAAEELIMGFSIQRAQSASSERSCMRFNIARPAISRVESGDWPSLSL